MGMLINGVWHSDADNATSKSGEFQRQDSSIRNWITTDGKPGKNGVDGFLAEPNRYHLYISLACPWAHRTLIFRKLKNLEDLISVSYVSPNMLDDGWTFNKKEGSSGDIINNFNYLHQVYTANNPNYTGKVTVPILWDKHKKCIVNNESAEIIRMFNSEFNHLSNNTKDYYPQNLQKDIDKINEFVYENINNGVYRCGFATTQEAYNDAYHKLFTALDKINTILTTNRYLVGSQITEADWRLFTTLIRFDSVYYGHFKCNKKSIENYPALREYLRELYQWPGIADTVNFTHIKQHYYFSHRKINPTQIVPIGPEIDYTIPHTRR